MRRLIDGVPYTNCRRPRTMDLSVCGANERVDGETCLEGTEVEAGSWWREVRERGRGASPTTPEEPSQLGHVSLNDASRSVTRLSHPTTWTQGFGRCRHRPSSEPRHFHADTCTADEEGACTNRFSSSFPCHFLQERCHSRAFVCITTAFFCWSKPSP